MPSLSPTMTEGTIVKWVKNEGEAVNAGDVVCEIQTDKAVVALEADDDGTLAKIIMPADSGTIKVGALIAVMAEEGEDWTSVESQGVIEEVNANEVVMPTGGGSTPGTEIKMPSLSPTMTEGTIVKWCKAEGEKLSAGDVLCEVQTDKAVVAMEVDDDAILAKILVPEGESGVPVNKLIALTVDEGEDWKDVQIPMIQDQDQGLDTLASTEEKSVQEVTESHVQAVPNAGPAVMLLCAQYGIDPSKVTSTGPKGLLKSDILKHIADNNLSALKITSKSSSAPPPSSPEVEQVKVSSPPPVGQSYVDIPLTSMRSVIAKRLSQSKSTSPHGYSTTQCNIDAINAIRNDLKAVGIKISLNDLIIKAAATALQLVPEVNLNTVGQDDYQVMGNIDIAVAVATPNGLITPIVPNVVDKSLPEISATVRDLAGRAREGKLQLNEFQVICFCFECGWWRGTAWHHSALQQRGAESCRVTVSDFTKKYCHF